MVKYILIICSIMGMAAAVSAQTDSAVVRIRTDVDSARILINNLEITEDSYGNALARDSWFIINLPTETYNIRIAAGDYDPVDSTITLLARDIYTFDIQFTRVDVEDTVIFFEELPETAGGVRLVVQSEPDSCSLVIGVKSLKKSVPFDLFVRPGAFSFLASKEGFDPLEATIQIAQGEPILANFRLKSIKPEKLTLESMGLTYMVQMPMLSIKQAEKVKTQYNSLTESFMIFPLAQGIMARIVVDESQRGVANALIVSGIGLTLGSHFLGKLLYKRKRQFIGDENLRRELSNAGAFENNRYVDQTVKDENAARLKAWVRANRNRGTVAIENIKEAQ